MCAQLMGEVNRKSLVSQANGSAIACKRGAEVEQKGKLQGIEQSYADHQ